MKTFENLIDELQNFCDNHPIDLEFGWGDILQLNTSEHKYPLVWLVPKTTTVFNDSLVYECDIVVAELMAQDRSNMKTITNKTLMVGVDIIKFFRYNVDELFLDETNVTFTYAEEQYDDVLQAWIINCRFQTQVDLASCDIISLING